MKQRRAGDPGGWSCVACALTVLVVGPAVAAERRGAELAAAAVEAMGGGAAIAALDGLAVIADCSGPGGEFTTEVFWRRPDRTLLIQRADGRTLERLAVGGRAWEPDRVSGRARPLPDEAAAMIQGHSFHPTLFELDHRFRDHRSAGTGPDGCLRVEMKDAAGRPAAVCLDPESKLPRTFSFEPSGPGGTIEMSLADWRRFGALRYFTAFTLRQGDEEYRYAYRSIRPDEVHPDLVELPAARPLEPGSRISLSLKDAELGEVLRSFAQMAGFDLVLDPSVRGAVTVELQDVPWERALEVILETHGLAAEIEGGTWRVRSR